MYSGTPLYGHPSTKDSLASPQQKKKLNNIYFLWNYRDF